MQPGCSKCLVNGSVWSCIWSYEDDPYQHEHFRRGRGRPAVVILASPNGFPSTSRLYGHISAHFERKLWKFGHSYLLMCAIDQPSSSKEGDLEYASITSSLLPDNMHMPTGFRVPVTLLMVRDCDSYLSTESTYSISHSMLKACFGKMGRYERGDRE